MFRLTNFPIIVLVLSFRLLWLSGWVGSKFRKKRQLEEDAAHADPGLLLGSALTLLGLIIGFTFSMAIGRYDQRKTMRKRKRTQLGRNTSGPTCYLPPTRRDCVPCWRTIPISGYCSTRPRMESD